MTSLNERKKTFSPKRMVIMAMFVALSYVVSLFEFSIFPATGFLKLDFGNVFILLIGFLLGPIEAIIVCLLKEALCIIGTSSNGVGQLANAIMTTSYIIVPCVVYRYKKGIKTVVLTLAIGCLLGTVVALFTNRFITFPLYAAFLPVSPVEAFNTAFWFVLAFNAIKTVSISLITVLIYKRLSWFIKKHNI